MAQLHLGLRPREGLGAVEHAGVPDIPVAGLAAAIDGRPGVLEAALGRTAERVIPDSFFADGSGYDTSKAATRKFREWARTLAAPGGPAAKDDRALDGVGEEGIAGRHGADRVQQRLVDLALEHVAAGAGLEHADEVTLGRALAGRRSLD